MRMMRLAAAAVVLAACGPAEQGDARGAASSMRDTARGGVRAGASSVSDTLPGGWKTVVRGADGFDFVLHRTATQQVDSVFVTRAGRRVQALVPSTLEIAVLRDPTYRVDVDFDGHLDFALATLVPAGPNVSFDYWRYDPAADRFRYLGEYQMLEPDSTSRTLFAHAREGHAGRSWSNSRWRWQNGKLVEFWRGGQVPAAGWMEGDDRLIYSESELRGGRWVVVRADTMQNCEADPLPDECVDAPAPAPASGVQAPPPS